MKTFKKEDQDLKYYKHEEYKLLVILEQELTKNFTNQDQVLITNLRGKILTNLRYQYKEEKNANNAVRIEILRKKISEVTSDHKKQISERQRAMAKETKNKYKISADFVLNVKKIQADLVRLSHSPEGKVPENLQELGKTFSMTLGTGYKATGQIYYGTKYCIMNVLYRVWNGTLAIDFKKTKRGKKIIKKSEKFDEKLREYIKEKSSKTR